MAESHASNGPPISLQQLIALNEEIAALVRAGVPLEQGLGHLGDDLPGRLGAITTQLAERMQQGRSLAEVLQERSVQIPPVYRAVVEAGIAGGRLPGALQSVSRSASQLADLRRVVGAASVYPLLVFLVAWGLFVLFVTSVVPRVLQSFAGVDAAALGLFVRLGDWGKWAAFWGPAVPLAVVILIGVWWLRSGAGSMVAPGAASVLFGWIPGVGRMLRALRTATFAEVLALLVENEVPLGKGLLLAAEASGDGRMVRGASRLAAAVERGGPPEGSEIEGSEIEAGDFPPLLQWLLGSGHRRGALLPALRHASAIYRRRAFEQAELTRVFLPLALTVLIGGGATLLYALAIFYPWCSFLHGLSRF